MNNPMNDPLVIKAVEFATQGHAAINQLRKYTQEPYIVHPLAVMDILLKNSSQQVTAQMLAASVCHDLVEDTDVTLVDVDRCLGHDVAVLVDWLTDISRPHHGNRKTRKAMDNAHTALAPVAAKNIKLADVIHNVMDITAHDPDFARVYIREKQELMVLLQDADPALISMARQTIEDCLAKLPPGKKK